MIVLSALSYLVPGSMNTIQFSGEPAKLNMQVLFHLYPSGKPRIKKNPGLTDMGLILPVMTIRTTSAAIATIIHYFVWVALDSAAAARLLLRWCCNTNLFSLLKDRTSARMSQAGALTPAVFKLNRVVIRITVSVSSNIQVPPPLGTILGVAGPIRMID